jgi:hypothetical protein
VSERVVKSIRRATLKQYSAKEKIRIVPDGLRGESSWQEAVGGRHGAGRDEVQRLTLLAGRDVSSHATAMRRR